MCKFAKFCENLKFAIHQILKSAKFRKKDVDSAYSTILRIIKILHFGNLWNTNERRRRPFCHFA